MPDDKALVKIEGFTALQKADRLGDVIKANFGNRGISIFNLERIRIPGAGGMQWQIIDPNGEETSSEEVTGVIAFKRDERNYWSKSFGDGPSVPPDCHSTDLDVGYGDNGQGAGSHKCRTCLQNQWRAGENDKSPSKPCRQVSLLFLLRQGREGHIFPSIMVVTPGSLKSLDGYLTSLCSQALFYHEGLHRFTLEKATNAQSIKYSRVRCQLLRKLTGPEMELMERYSKALEGAFGSVQLTSEEVQAQ